MRITYMLISQQPYFFLIFCREKKDPVKTYAHDITPRTSPELALSPNEDHDQLLESLLKSELTIQSLRDTVITQTGNVEYTTKTKNVGFSNSTLVRFSTVSYFSGFRALTALPPWMTFLNPCIASFCWLSNGPKLCRSLRSFRGLTRFVGEEELYKDAGHV